MAQFVADFEAYMPSQFNGRPYGVEGLQATADEAGIDTCVVFPGGLPPDPRRINANLLAETAAAPERVLPGCLINPTMGEAAVEDVQRCVDAGAKALKLMGAAHGYRLDASCVDPVMAAAAELGIPVTIHSGSPLSGCSPEFIGRLASRHPQATIIMDHMGYREWVGLAVEAAVAQANIFLGTTLIAAAEPITIKNVILEGQIGAERIVFGSNSPSGVAANGVNGLRSVDFGEEAEALILGGNLKRIYGL